MGVGVFISSTGLSFITFSKIDSFLALPVGPGFDIFLWLFNVGGGVIEASDGDRHGITETSV